MLNIDNPHQIFQVKDDNGELICRWTMDKIKRKDATVWVMNHIFINPQKDSKQILHDQMKIVMLIAQESQIPVWPLDPMIIDYFKHQPDFANIWYHRPDSNNDSL